MSRKVAPLLPATVELLRQFGDRLRLARLRRGLSAKQVAERAGMNPMTLRSLERGGDGVTIGAYIAVMQVLGIEKEFDHIALADPLGRSLQDAALTGGAAPSMNSKKDIATHTPAPSATRARAGSNPRNRVDEGTFVNSRELAALIRNPVSRPSTRKPSKISSSKAKRR